ncbi:galactose oxidase [Luteolibacter ambystomatis]|uniref:Galactose oxidase n=1 Tax=Luteolibacter ambystomatis TaxID=2824561 RepID=A0A975PEW8_9BACT|nr:galactose oxidase [Luteolibacter ambystomatis]QUE51580.1 galactose oxidase [Luteolibacter ambystomatis]
MSSSLTPSLIAAALSVLPSAGVAGISTTLLPQVPDERGFAGAFTGVQDHILLAGGGANFPDGRMPWDGGTKVWHDKLFSLDLSKPDATWQEIGKLPAANGYGVSLTVPEGVLLIGGGDAARNFREVHLLTLEDTTPRFRALPLLPEPLAQMCGAMIGRKVHLCGGIVKPDSTTASSKHWVLDLDAMENGWKEEAGLPAPSRILATAAAVDESFFVMGGCSLAPDDQGKPKRTYLQDAWMFKDGRWTQLADMPRPAVGAATPAPVVNHSLLLVSGDDGTQVGIAKPEEHKGFARDVHRYDLVSGTWSKDGMLTLPPPVTLAVAPWKDGTIFFNGEVRPGVRTNQVFILHPDR